MYSLATVLIFSFFALAIGAAAGMLLSRRFGGQSNLEQRLQQAEQQFKDYQADVTEHFEETSRRVNALTRNYKDVHEYLASSAMKLTDPQLSRAISQAARQNLPHPNDEEQQKKKEDADRFIDSDPEELTANSEFELAEERDEVKA